MKSFIKQIIPLLFFAVACHENNSQLPDNNLQVVPDSAKQYLLKIIEGGWVNVEYEDTFYRYHSPMFAARYGLPVQQLAFDISRLDHDTLENAYHRYTYSASERFDLVFKNENGKIKMIPRPDAAVKLPMEELKYQVKGGDTTLQLVIGNKMYSYRRVFRQFPESENIHPTALDYFANSILADVIWKSGNKYIHFNIDGTISNFRSYNRYSIKVKDDHPQSQPDEITFYNDNTAVTYAFVLNTTPRLLFDLELYDLKESKDGLEFTRGKLVTALRGGTYFVTGTDQNGSKNK
ncbi:MAG: hypothetical protein HY064_15900 [Bacteroidetes bacterium]|nr:hypothetical protein [Bacteroidota bacterium]